MGQPLEAVAGSDNVEVVGKEIKEIPAPPSAELLLAQANALGEQLRALIVTTKRLPRDKSLESHQDPVRSLSLAQAHLQTGFMWLRRAIEAPKVF